MGYAIYEVNLYFCKCRADMHDLNEGHRGREVKMECFLCGDECENVSHMLWECSI